MSDMRDFIAKEGGCEVGKWPLTYLGMPLGGNEGCGSFWGQVVEKVLKRLDVWNKRCLTRGGRLVLLKISS